MDTASDDAHFQPLPENKIVNILKTQRNKLQFHLHGHVYTLAGYRTVNGKKDESKQIWKCSSRNTGTKTKKQVEKFTENNDGKKPDSRTNAYCPGRIWVRKMGDDYFLQKIVRHHSHGSDLATHPLAQVRILSFFLPIFTTIVMMSVCLSVSPK